MDSTVATVYWSFFIVTTIAIMVGLWGVFVKAGKPGWMALIPFYNYYVTIKIVEKPKWWLILVFIPIVNLVMPLVLVIEFCKYYGRPGLGWQTVGMLFPYVFLPYIGFHPKIKYGKVKAKKKKSRVMEWTEAIVFALIAATFIRTFFIEAYRIPTPSMESSLLVGDHLFVSKFHYGARFPMTPIAFPLAHHTMPLLGTKAYIDWPRLPYFRFPGLQKIHRNDVVVFNFPEGDTVLLANQQASYYDLVRQNNGVRFPPDAITVRPVDKNENYVKRCVAIPGDSLEVRGGQLYINGSPAQNPPGMQFMYWIMTSQSLPQSFFTQRGISEVQSLGGGGYQVFATPQAAKEISTITAIDSVYRPFDDPHNQVASNQVHNWTQYSQLFPNNGKRFPFTPDNYGPIWVPQKGVTVTLTDKNIDQLRRVIRIYERNTLEERNGQFFINGKQTTTYTFRYDYYFMMGDNRHNSQDSRYWGFVPETHIVGKPWFVWLSIDKNRSFPNNIRWNRLFNGVK